MKKYYQIAGLCVEMDTFGRTEKQAEPYRCAAAEPDIVIPTGFQELKDHAPYLSDDDCEYVTTGGRFYRKLLAHGGMMLHSSAVVLDGWAYLFSAPCGTGKSTHTGLWLKAFPDRAFLLNDDKPALRCEDGTWYAYGTPWSGKNDISRNIRVPVAGICYLHQAAENTIEPLEGKKAIFCLLEQTARSRDPQLCASALELLDKLIAGVSVWQMGCNMDLDAARMSHRVMSASIKKEK